MAKELYVGHISDNATEEDIRKLFSVVGAVTSVHLIIDPETREFKRCGYVRMAPDIDLNEVVETLDGALLIDEIIHVSIARPQKPGMSKSGKSGRFGGARKPGLGPKASAGPKGGPERKSGDEAKPATETRTGRGRSRRAGGDAKGPRPGGEKRGPRKGR